MDRRDGEDHWNQPAEEWGAAGVGDWKGTENGSRPALGPPSRIARNQPRAASGGGASVDGANGASAGDGASGGR
jgi:hypothetical protein